MYIQLIDNGWSLNDVDESDFFYYMDLLIYKANKKDKESVAYIDQIY